jgi:hypothetical protein
MEENKSSSTSDVNAVVHVIPMQSTHSHRSTVLGIAERVTLKLSAVVFFGRLVKEKFRTLSGTKMRKVYKHDPKKPQGEWMNDPAEEMRLKNEMISDLTGLEDYNAEQAPLAIHELAAHLIRKGWHKA